MAETLILIDPKNLHRNPDNPRLIFHQEELDALAESISHQGILVPLTVYKDRGTHYLLDGERRWRCATKLGLTKVPVIVQPKPERLQNIMMMFAIHHARKDWDPLPTALKLEELEEIFSKEQGRKPTEKELAELASMQRGEVRRLRKLLALPSKYRKLLMVELEKPRNQQIITVDQILEATNGASALRKRDIIDKKTENTLRDAIVNKFKKRIIKNTVAPRKLARIARAVYRKELSKQKAKSIVERLINQPTYDIDRAFHESAEEIDFQHNLIQITDRFILMLKDHKERGYDVSDRVKQSLVKVRNAIDILLKR